MSTVARRLATAQNYGKASETVFGLRRANREPRLATFDSNSLAGGTGARWRHRVRDGEVRRLEDPEPDEGLSPHPLEHDEGGEQDGGGCEEQQRPRGCPARVRAL